MELLDHLLLGADRVEYSENVTGDQIQEVVEALREETPISLMFLSFTQTMAAVFTVSSMST
ncbi:hypothetical protein [Bacillus sp. JCM 19041]|uniref:hypothetical protein n=1 Tax=Bacillus sp. JCM 19041 TaxID=1460637 RepID=UPI0006D1CCCD